jgi:hypothetical protein
MGKWLAGIVGAVLIAVLSQWATNWMGPLIDPKSPSPSPTAPPEKPKVTVMSPLEQGINRQGNDLDSQGVPANNAADCAEICRTNSNCDAMTYVISTRMCWPKNGVPNPTVDADMISAFKR